MVFLTALSLCAWFFKLAPRTLSDQSGAKFKLKPIVPWSLAFSRAWDEFPLFTLSSHWLLVILTFVQIGSCDYFGFGCTTL